MSILSYSFYSLPLKLPNKEIDFLFPLLKLPNKGREEYSKIILFIPFHSISIPPPKRGLIRFIDQLSSMVRYIDIRVLNLNSLHPHMTLLKVRCNSNLLPGWRQLLCFDKQLLMIYVYIDYEVYELNFLKMELVRIPNLGDLVLFQDFKNKFSGIGKITSWEVIGISPSNNCIYRIWKYDFDYFVEYFFDGRCPQTFPNLARRTLHIP